VHRAHLRSTSLDVSSQFTALTYEGQFRTQVARTNVRLTQKPDVRPPSVHVRLVPICCGSPLQGFLVSDSVAVMRFATGGDHDGGLNHEQGRFFLLFNLDEGVPDDDYVLEVAPVLDLSWVHSELARYRGCGIVHCAPAKMPSDPGSCPQSRAHRTSNRQGSLAHHGTVPAPSGCRIHSR
jgi:hypothetical protein